MFLHPEYFIIKRKRACQYEVGQGLRNERTYADYRRVIWYCWRLVLLDRAWALLNSQVFYILAAKDDVLVDLITGCGLVLSTAPPALGTEGPDVL